MKIRHNGRSDAVERALVDFGIKESFVNAANRFKEHYHYDIGPSAVARVTKKTTPVHKNPKKEKIINWGDVRLGFVRPLISQLKVFSEKLDSYPKVVKQMHGAAVLIGMTEKTEVIGVADGGIGLSEELIKQFPSMHFILDKSHFRDHLYATAEAIGIKQKKTSSLGESAPQKSFNWKH